MKKKNTLRTLRLTNRMLCVLLAICLVGIAVLGRIYLLELRKNQFSKNVLLSNNYMLQVSGFDESNVESRSEEIDGSVLETIELNVNGVCQLPEYPNGCEAASATILLRTMGIDISLDEFIEKHLPKEKVKISFGCRFGPNPAEYYAGNPASERGGWGCYSPVIVSALRSALRENSEYLVKNLSGNTLDTLEEYLRMGIPVAIWATTDMEEAEEFYQWQSFDRKESFLYPTTQHCVVLCGVSQTGEYVYYDPLLGEKTTIDASSLNLVYESMGRQAVTVATEETLKKIDQMIYYGEEI